MSSEPLLKKLAKPKKVRPRMVDIESPTSDSPEDDSRSNAHHQPEDQVDFESAGSSKRHRHVPPDPSAPPEEAPLSGLLNPDSRRRFLQKVFAVLMVQQTLVAVSIAIFVYMKIARKLIFDKLFLTSVFGFPLFVGFVLFSWLMPSILRRFAWITFTVLTLCLCLLLSYVISQETASYFLFSVGASDLCSLLVIGASFGRSVDFTSWRLFPSIPLFMLTASCLAPAITNQSWQHSLLPSAITTGLMTYLGYSTRPVIRFNQLDLQPNEHVFAATQLYAHPLKSLGKAAWSLKSRLFNRRSGYNQI